MTRYPTLAAVMHFLLIQWLWKTVITALRRLQPQQAGEDS